MDRSNSLDPDLADLIKKPALELLEIIYADPQGTRAAGAKEVLEYLKYRVSFWHNVVVLVLSAVVATATLVQVYFAVRDPATQHQEEICAQVLQWLRESQGVPSHKPLAAPAKPSTAPSPK